MWLNRLLLPYLLQLAPLQQHQTLHEHLFDAAVAMSAMGLTACRLCCTATAAWTLPASWT